MAPKRFPEGKSYALRVTVVGHASSRWRGAKNRAEADQLNEALSNERATNVRAAVEQSLKRLLPDLPIIRPANGKAVLVDSYGLGSRVPVKPMRPDPDENDPINRSVVVMIELTTTTHGHAWVPAKPLRADARSNNWKLTVTTLEGAAVGAAAYFIRVVLRNSLSSLSGKEAVYSGYIFGGGAGAQVSGHQNPGKIGKPIGDAVWFKTDKVMGFSDFAGQLIRVEKVGASLGIKATASYLSFVSLKTDPSLLGFDQGFGIGGPSLAAFVASGRLTMESPDPGDWFEMAGGEDSVPTTTDSSTGDGLILSFPTGQAGVNNLVADDRIRLEDFLTRWALQVPSR
jgi:hypothetical protein